MFQAGTLIKFRTELKTNFSLLGLELGEISRNSKINGAEPDLVVFCI